LWLSSCLRRQEGEKILNLHYIKGTDLVCRDVAGETIIVPIRGHVGDLNSIYSLNETGTMIWRLLDGWKSVGEIIDATCEDFEVPKGEAEKDVFSFLSSLRDVGLIRSVEEEKPGD
jgi:hypothetical protein